MKKHLFFIFAMMLSNISIAQISGDCNAPFNTPEGLVEILVGDGVEFSNVSFSGFECSAGYFSGSSNIGFPQGLVMATGGVESIAPGGFGGGFGGSAVDNDLSDQLDMVNASASNLNNLIILEFDFIPNSDTVTFEYVFASLEYPSYTCSQFNDIFGFFLSGPGISGPFTNNAENIALIPDPNNPTEYTTTPVIINTVNSGEATSFDGSGPCDDIDPNWQDYSVFFTDNTGSESVNFPGFTVPLTARAVVTACETYHIKLAIADVFDSALNSAVFFQENSFSAIPDVEYVLDSELSNIFNPNSPYIDDLFEGCESVSITFERPVGIAGDILIDYSLEGEAVFNSDYSIPGLDPTQIIIPEGESEFVLDLFPLSDTDDTEISEDIVLIFQVLNFGCYDVLADTVQLTIRDQPDLVAELDDLAGLCPDDEVQLSVVPSGGVGGLMTMPYSVPPYTFQWVGLGTNATQIVNPLETTEYCVDVVDVCGQEVQKCTTVIIEDAPELSIILTENILLECPGDNAVLGVEAQGGIGSLMTPPFPLPPYTYQWAGLGTNASQFISANVDTEFCVLVTDVCGQEVEGCIEVNIQEFPPVQVSSEIVYVCDSIEFDLCSTVEGGNGTYSFLWSNGEDTPCLFDFPEDYTITVVDECGVQGAALGSILVDEAPNPFFESFQMPDENFGVFLNNYTPTMNGLTYQWSFGDGLSSGLKEPEEHFYEEWGVYTVNLGVTTAINNCYKEYSTDVEISPLYYFYAPNSFTPNEDGVNDFFTPSLVGAKTYEIYIFDRWGKQVFYSDTTEKSWDGSYNSEKAIAGIYAFKVVTTKQFDENTYEEKGFVNLIR